MTIYCKQMIMKIVVTRSATKKQSYVIAVVDSGNCIHKESVDGVAKRDEVVWKLADLYNALDIEIVEPDREEFKFTEIPVIPVLDEEEAEEYFEDNKEVVYDRVIQAIKEGLHVNRSEIRLFELNGTGVFLTSKKPNWKCGLEQALQHYIEIEAYEKCISVNQLMAKL